MYQTKISAISCHQMPRLAIDAGNRFIKVAAPGFRKVLPAYYSKANFRDSEAVEYRAGDRNDLTQVRGKLAGEIYQGLGDIESAKLAANTEGIKALEQVQQRRRGYRSMRVRLIKDS